jgi:hypothetical protein
MKGFIARSTLWGTIQTTDRFYALPIDQQIAVSMHEAGHIKRKHAWKRLGWILMGKAFFQTERFFEMCAAQELEADSYVRDSGYGRELATFLISHVRSTAPGYPSVRRRLENLNV